MKALVLVVSGLQLDYVGCWGNSWIATPALDRLAAEGVVFDQHFADQPDAVGARRAWRTGRYHLPPFDAGPVEPAAEADLLALLRGAGVATELLRDGRHPLPDEFAVGWGSVHVVAPEDGNPLDEALLVLDDLADPGLLWVELTPLLPPWDVPEELRDLYLDPPEDAEEPLAPWEGPLPETVARDDETTFLRLQGSYAAAVVALDDLLGSFLEELRSRELLDELLLIVTTDRGWPLGEHGFVGDVGVALHEERAHLPLLLRLPSGAEAGRRVAALTQPVDLMPTLLEAFGVARPEMHGHSLWPLVRGEQEGVREYACGGLRRSDAAAWALRTLDEVLLLASDDQRPRLYVKPDDRWEVNDLVQQQLEWADLLEQTLRAFVAATRGAGPLRPPPIPDLDRGESYSA